MKVHYNADPSIILKRKIAVIGYGSQGHAHALNLRDSGATVVVGLRDGSSSADKARSKGLKVMSIADAASWGDVIMILIPDQDQKHVYEAEISKHVVPGKALAFGHGFNVHYGQIQAPDGVDVFMVAPKGPGHLVRRTFEEGKGTPCLVAVAQNASGGAMELALSYADAIGGTRAGVIETNFKDETETDLFGEQAVLCGGSQALIQAGFETLIEAGYPEELAYFEVLHELKLIVDLYYEGGLSYMNYSISDTAEYGNYSRGPRVIGPQVKEEMKRILSEIQSGQFAHEWIAECEEGQPTFQAYRKQTSEHPVEKVGQKLRKMMAWLRKNEDTVEPSEAT